MDADGQKQGDGGMSAKGDAPVDRDDLSDRDLLLQILSELRSLSGRIPEEAPFAKPILSPLGTGVPL